MDEIVVEALDEARVTVLPFSHLIADARTRGPRQEDEIGHAAIVLPACSTETLRADATGRWVVSLATALAERRSPWTVDVILIGDPATEQITDRVVARVLSAHRLGAARISGSEAFSWELPEALQEVSAVLIARPLSRSGEVASLVAKALGKVTVAIMDDAVSSTVGVSLGLLDLVDAVVCHSASGATALPRAIRATVIPGGVDHRFFRPLPRPRERKHFLVAGRIGPSDGVDRMLQELPLDVPVVICAQCPDNRYRERLRTIARHKTVLFEDPGDNERLRRLYRGAWATVQPPPDRATPGSGQYGGLHETSGPALFTAIESMACATPVIVPSAEPLREFVEDGGTGLFCDTLPDFIDRLVALLRNPSLVEEFGANALRQVRARYTMEDVAAQIDDLLANHASTRTGALVHQQVPLASRADA